jgi:hypothetical protein
MFYGVNVFREVVYSRKLYIPGNRKSFFGLYDLVSPCVRIVNASLPLPETQEAYVNSPRALVSAMAIPSDYYIGVYSTLQTFKIKQTTYEHSSPPDQTTTMFPI